MIDDNLLELAADCYVALRAHGYLEDFPTFESFLRRAVGQVRLPEKAPAEAGPGLARLPAAPPPERPSAN